MVSALSAGHTAIGIAMRNPILCQAREILKEGLPISSVSVSSTNGVCWDVCISTPLFIDHREQSNIITNNGTFRCRVGNPPKGVAVSGKTRHPDIVFTLPIASEDDVRAWIMDVAYLSRASEITKYTGDNHISFLAKTLNWSKR